MKKLYSQHFRSISLAPRSLRITEGDVDTPNAVFQVRLNKAAHVPITVVYAVDRLNFINGMGALPGDDYDPPTGRTLTFPMGSRVQTISIPILDDTVDEPTEGFTLIIALPTNAILHGGGNLLHTTVLIIDNDGPPTLSLSVLSLRLVPYPKDGGLTLIHAFSFHVQSSQVSSKIVTVDYATRDGTAKTGWTNRTKLSLCN